MKKKSLVIFLLTILLMESGGWLLFFQLKQWYVQAKVEYALIQAETKFEELTLPTSDFHKGKINPREIAYKGNLYDIKSITLKGDQVKLSVINDTEELSVLKVIKNLVTLNKTKKQQGKGKLKLARFVYINPCVENPFFLFQPVIKEFKPFLENYRIVFKENKFPPPKVVTLYFA